MDKCPNCGYLDPVTIPREPPIGSCVIDNLGRHITRSTNGHWGQTGFYAMAKWIPMYQKWGPLKICGKCD